MRNYFIPVVKTTSLSNNMSELGVMTLMCNSFDLNLLIKSIQLLFKFSTLVHDLNHLSELNYLNLNFNN